PRVLHGLAGAGGFARSQGFAGRPLGLAVDGRGLRNYAQSRHGDPPKQGTCVESKPGASNTRLARLSDRKQTSSTSPDGVKSRSVSPFFRACFPLVFSLFLACFSPLGGAILGGRSASLEPDPGGSAAGPSRT